MEIFEELAMQHLTLDPYEFPHPQFSIGKGWSCPDFVSLNVKQMVVRVIEVSTAYDLSNLTGKVNSCENQWFSRLRQHFMDGSIVGGDWDYRIRIYIRRDSNFQQAKIDQQVAGKLEVVFFEGIGFPWQGWYPD